MSNNNQPYGVDVSSYQGQIDFNKLLPKIKFLAARATISWGYQDKWFERNRILSGDLPFFAYHVLYPGENADAQMDNLLRAAPFDGKIRYCIDSELAHGNTKLVITNAIRNVSERLKAETGHYPIQYSRASWLDQYVNIYDLPDMDWWLAHYLNNVPGNPYTPEHPGPPALPKGVSIWLIHQTGSHGNGLEHGVPASANQFIDQNRWNGTEADLLAYFGHTEDEPEPEPEPEPPVEKLFDARVTTTPPNRLKTRYTPAGLERPEADWLQSQAIVPVYETHSTGWWRVAPEAWSSATWMQRVDNLPLPPPMSGDYAYFGGVYNQRDIRWKDHALGTKSTIGANGCLMTCASMVCNHFGHASNPLQLNQWLTDNEGYLDGNLFLWAAIERLYPDMRFDGFVYNPTTAQIRAAILAGVLPIMYVDFDDSTPLIEMHWVLGIGVTNTDVLIADPWTGTMGKLSEMYPKQVIRFGSYIRRN